MKTIKVKFQNRREQTLSASIEMPLNNKPDAFALFAHCFTCSKDLIAVTNISRALSMENVAVLRFDFTGLGQSEGDFADTNFSSNVDDLIDACKFLTKEYEAPQLIIGHSLGGAAVILAASTMPNIKAVVTIGAPADPPHVKHLFEESLDEINAQGVASVSIGGRPFTIKKQFIDDLERNDLSEVIANLKKALLVMHSPQDATVGVENAAKIYTAAKHPKSFISLDGADHLLLKNKADSLYVGQVIASWAHRYLELPEKKTDLVTDKQVAVRTGDESYTTEIKAGKHTYLADEPERVGGADLGPDPYSLLLSSLGACTSMTLQMYAKRKKWDLKNVTVHLEHNRSYEEDCAEVDKAECKIEVISREIEIEGDLDDTQRQRLLEIADKCPVHKTLHSNLKVETKLI